MSNTRGRNDSGSGRTRGWLPPPASLPSCPQASPAQVSARSPQLSASVPLVKWLPPSPRKELPQITPHPSSQPAYRRIPALAVCAAPRARPAASAARPAPTDGYRLLPAAPCLAEDSAAVPHARMDDAEAAEKAGDDGRDCGAGCPPYIRNDVWPLLLGIHALSSTEEERAQQRRAHGACYHKLRMCARILANLHRHPPSDRAAVTAVVSHVWTTISAARPALNAAQPASHASTHAPSHASHAHSPASQSHPHMPGVTSPGNQRSSTSSDPSGGDENGNCASSSAASCGDSSNGGHNLTGSPSTPPPAPAATTRATTTTRITSPLPSPSPMLAPSPAAAPLVLHDPVALLSDFGAWQRAIRLDAMRLSAQWDPFWGTGDGDEGGGSGGEVGSLQSPCSPASTSLFPASASSPGYAHPVQRWSPRAQGGVRRRDRSAVGGGVSGSGACSTGNSSRISRSIYDSNSKADSSRRGVSLQGEALHHSPRPSVMPSPLTPAPRATSLHRSTNTPVRPLPPTLSSSPSRPSPPDLHGMRLNFLLDESGIHRQLAALGRILRLADPELHGQVRDMGGGDCLFAYRMVVVGMRRDLPLPQTLMLWEVCWADALAAAMPQGGHEEEGEELAGKHQEERKQLVGPAGVSDEKLWINELPRCNDHKENISAAGCMDGGSGYGSGQQRVGTALVIHGGKACATSDSCGDGNGPRCSAPVVSQCLSDEVQVQEEQQNGDSDDGGEEELGPPTGSLLLFVMVVLIYRITLRGARKAMAHREPAARHAVVLAAIVLWLCASPASAADWESLKNVLDPAGSVLTTWTNQQDPCSPAPFLGVRCDASNNVVAVDLANRNLGGQVPEQLVQLYGVTTVNLQGNALTGSLPSSLNSLANLQALLLSSNQLAGPLPELSSLSQLTMLDVSHNQLQGSIPDWLSDLSQLKYLELNSNRFKGSLPESLSALTTLRDLHVDGNKLTGKVSPSLAFLSATGASFNFTQSPGFVLCGPPQLGLPPDCAAPSSPAPPAADPGSSQSASPPTADTPGTGSNSAPAAGKGDPATTAATPAATPADNSSSNTTSSSGGSSPVVVIVAGVLVGLAVLLAVAIGLLLWRMGWCGRRKAARKHSGAVYTHAPKDAAEVRLNIVDGPAQSSKAAAASGGAIDAAKHGEDQPLNAPPVAVISIAAHKTAPDDAPWTSDVGPLPSSRLPSATLPPLPPPPSTALRGTSSASSADGAESGEPVGSYAAAVAATASAASSGGRFGRWGKKRGKAQEGLAEGGSMRASEEGERDGEGEGGGEARDELRAAPVSLAAATTAAITAAAPAASVRADGAAAGETHSAESPSSSSSAELSAGAAAPSAAAAAVGVASAECEEEEEGSECSSGSGRSGTSSQGGRGSAADAKDGDGKGGAAESSIGKAGTGAGAGAAGVLATSGAAESSSSQGRSKSSGTTVSSAAAAAVSKLLGRWRQSHKEQQGAGNNASAPPHDAQGEEGAEQREETEEVSSSEESGEEVEGGEGDEAESAAEKSAQQCAESSGAERVRSLPSWAAAARTGAAPAAAGATALGASAMTAAGQAGGGVQEPASPVIAPRTNQGVPPVLSPMQHPPVIIPPVVPLPSLRSLPAASRSSAATAAMPRVSSATGITGAGIAGAAAAAAARAAATSPQQQHSTPHLPLDDALRLPPSAAAAAADPLPPPPGLPPSSAPTAALAGLRPAYGAAGRALRAADVEDAEDRRAGDRGEMGASGSAASSTAAGAHAADLPLPPKARINGSDGIATQSDDGSVAGSGVSVGGELRWFSVSELAMATNEFGRNAQRNVVGTGRYGTVYRARLADGSTAAVKRLTQYNPDQTPREFRFEVETLATLRHPNLIALIGGCCAEPADCGSAGGAERMLVTEYAANGDLDTWLHPDDATLAANAGAQMEAIDWPMRMHVAVGCAKGLAYLHDVRVVHSDVRAANVLLDHRCDARLCDFAFARIVGSDPKHASARHALRSFGYMAPEYMNTGVLTERSDVYSFGVLLLEIITGRRPIDSQRPSHESNLVKWAKQMAGEGRFLDMVDPRLCAPDMGGTAAVPVAIEDATYVVGVALRCLEPNALKRPKMKQVVHMLESEDPCLREDWVARRPSVTPRAVRDTSPSWSAARAFTDSAARTSPRFALSSPRHIDPTSPLTGAAATSAGSAYGGGLVAPSGSASYRSASPRSGFSPTAASPKAADIGSMITSAALRGNSPHHAGNNMNMGMGMVTPTHSAAAAAAAAGHSPTAPSHGSSSSPFHTAAGHHPSTSPYNHHHHHAHSHGSAAGAAAMAAAAAAGGYGQSPPPYGLQSGSPASAAAAAAAAGAYGQSPPRFGQSPRAAAFLAGVAGAGSTGSATGAGAPGGGYAAGGSLGGGMAVGGMYGGGIGAAGAGGLYGQSPRATGYYGQSPRAVSVYGQSPTAPSYYGHSPTARGTSPSAAASRVTASSPRALSYGDGSAGNIIASHAMSISSRRMPSWSRR
ncbi:unnamed protein product [Closterium sp. NIES-65]|nr:unnamed protein product [Closterium sp. NIES-65]